jgi:MFS family permease
MVSNILERRASVVVMLGVTQTLAWASSYYVPAILADPIARDLGITSTHVFTAFSTALILSALLGPSAGRRIDRFGGRGVLIVSNFIFAAGLCLLARAEAAWSLWLAWMILGFGMGIGLYDAAFATLGRLYGTAARGSITGITLFAGFASTIGWPLSAWGVAEIGWRNTCLVWAAAHILIGLPLNLLLPRAGEAITISDIEREKFQGGGEVRMDRTMWLLAIAFAAAWFVTAAMAAHLPRILEGAGATTVQAVAAAALVGPAQVAARIFEATALRNVHPLQVARIAATTHPVGAAVAMLLGASASFAFTILHGLGNGILTIARGTVPLAIYGPVNYGYRLGILGAPSRIAQATAPLLFGLLLERMGFAVLAVSGAISVLAFVALMMISSTKTPP